MAFSKVPPGTSGDWGNFLNSRSPPIADQNQERRNYSGEPGPQADPALREGPASTTRTWVITGVIAAALLAVMYGVTAHRQDAKNDPQITTGSNQTPSQSGGRTTGDAPANPAVTQPPRSGG
jgi:hypothetical protein